jgi:hypothetical protein
MKFTNAKINLFPHSDSIIVVCLKVYIVETFCGSAREWFFGKGFLADSYEIPYEEILVRQIIGDFRTDDVNLLCERVAAYQSC